jgi:hypothetical protein
MSTESVEHKTATVLSPSQQRADEDIFWIDDRAKTALQELQESELLQLVRVPMGDVQHKAKRLP